VWILVCWLLDMVGVYVFSLSAVLWHKQERMLCCVSLPAVALNYRKHEVSERVLFCLGVRHLKAHALLGTVSLGCLTSKQAENLLQLS
jgi:hypothetical protein